MKIEPSASLEPYNVVISPEFMTWMNSLNNWQLIGLETMTVWLKSTIAAYSLTKIGGIEGAQRAATLE